VDGAGATGSMPTALNAHILTSPGMAVGTIAYMSPEQAMGEELDDAPTCFSGDRSVRNGHGTTRVFRSTSAAVFDAILHRAPVAPLELNPQLPPKLEEILDKALEKDLKLRYQTASDFRVDLQRLRRESDSHPSAKSSVQAAIAEGAPTRAPIKRRRWQVSL